MMTVVIDSDMWLLVCVNYAIWLVLSSTCHFLTDNFHCRQRPTRNACCGRETARCRCKTRYVSEFTAASCSPPCGSTAPCFHSETKIPHTSNDGHETFISGPWLTDHHLRSAGASACCMFSRIWLYTCTYLNIAMTSTNTSQTTEMNNTKNSTIFNSCHTRLTLMPGFINSG